MKNRVLKIAKTPDLSEDFVQIDVNERFEKICLNNTYLIRDTLNILDFLLINNGRKPLIIYNMLFLVELFLKWYLIKYSKMTLEEIEDNGHNIVELINLANMIDPSFYDLRDLLSIFKDKNNNNLNLNKYYNYKYNHKIGEEVLIFEFDMSEKEKENTREVIEWIKCHM